MIYLDNSATTYPKPAAVLNSVGQAMKALSFNSGRGGYRQSLRAAEKIFEVRGKVADMFHFEAQNVAFTMNCTYALNMAIKGSVKKGDHIIISSLEHNAVWRVVNKLKADGIADFDIAPYSYDDDKTVSNFEGLIRKNTALIVCTGASNVFGVMLPIGKIGAMAKRRSVRFIVDAAQTAGLIPIDAEKDRVDILCAPAHKCLYGAMGTGFLAVADSVGLDTIIEGGTGSNSQEALQPDFLPDRFESGTLPNSGILSLGAGIDFINSRGADSIYTHELSLTSYLYDMLSKNENAVLYCPKPQKNRSVPIISFNYKDYESEKTASLLAEHDIAVRAGYHCAPLAHRYFGTYGRGTVRLSPSAFTTGRECEIFIKTLKKL